MRIYFDIETIPSQHPDALAHAAKTLKVPGTLKKLESINAWWENEAPAATGEAWRKTALDGAVGEIISISWADDDMPEAKTTIRAVGESEAALLQEFFRQIQQHLTDNAIRDAAGNDLWEDKPYFIGHNAAFDIGFVWRRCIVLGVRPPFRLPTPAAREGKDYGCTMRAWAGYGNTISLDRLCTALGIPTPKGDLDGSKVFDAWLAGELERIARYNAADVIATREIWRRLNWENAA